MASSLDKLANAPTSSKMVMLFLLMGIVGAGWWVLYYSEVSNAADKEVRDTPMLGKKIKDAKAKIAERRKKESQVHTLRQIKTKMREKLPTDHAVSQLLEQIHTLAGQVGLKIITFEHQESEEQESYIELPVFMRLDGTYKQITDFFEQLGEREQIVNVGDIVLSAPGDRRNDDGTINEHIVATCRLTTFKYKAPEKSIQPKKKKKKGKK